MLRNYSSIILVMAISVAWCAYVASEVVPTNSETNLKRQRRKLDSFQIHDAAFDVARRELGVGYIGTKGTKGGKSSGKGGSKGGSGKGSSKSGSKGTKGDSSGKGGGKGYKGGETIQAINNELKTKQVLEQDEAAALLELVQSNMSMDTTLDTMDGTVSEAEQKTDESRSSAEDVVQEIIDSMSGAQGSFISVAFASSAIVMSLNWS